jgi:hypothetical protein
VAVSFECIFSRPTGGVKPRNSVYCTFAMARMLTAKLLPAVLLACAVTLLSLSSCALLFAGYFSQELAQATAVADLSHIVPASPASSFNLSIVASGSDEYVLLYSSTPFDPSQNHLVVLSPTLEVLQLYTGSDINAVAPPGGPFRGTSAVAHLVDGHIVIGNLEAIPSSAHHRPPLPGPASM